MLGICLDLEPFKMKSFLDILLILCLDVFPTPPNLAYCLPDAKATGGGTL